MRTSGAPNYGRRFSVHAPDCTRLRLASVVERLQLSPVDLAVAVGLSQSAATHLMRSNMAPLRIKPALLAWRIRSAMARLGATADELATLFDAEAINPPSLSGAAESATADGRAATLQESDVLSLKATLTPQAKKHFRLFVDPFAGPVTEPKQFYNGDEIRFVRESAWQCAQNAGMLAIVGESGAGKTTILEDLEERLKAEPQGYTVVRPSIVGMEPVDSRGKAVKSTDLLAAIITKLSPEAAMPATLEARSTVARKLLGASVDMGNRTLLLIDEAHCMPDSTLKHLKRMHELRSGRRPLLGVLLLAQPELKRRLENGLRDGSLREVSQRCEVVDLLPLDDELKAYLQCRAAAVGADLAKIIDDSGIAQLRARLTLRQEGRKPISMAFPLAAGNWMARAMNLCAEIGAPLISGDAFKAI